MSISLTNKPSHDKVISNNDYLEKSLTEFRKLYTDNNNIRNTDIRSSVEPMDRKLKRSDSPRNSKSPPRKPYENSEQREAPLPPEVLELQVKKEALMKEKEEKKAELEILKENINKMYNLETRKSPSVQQMSETSESEDKENCGTKKGNSERSAEGEYEVNKITESRPLGIDGLDSGNTTDAPPDAEGGGEQISPKMTIIISPKSPIDFRPLEKRRSLSPEQAAKLTRNDVLDAIFHTDVMKETSSNDMEMESKDERETVTDEEQLHTEDYADDFSADVDNYNAISEYETSPISLAKPIDDENFWDS